MQKDIKNTKPKQTSKTEVAKIDKAVIYQAKNGAIELRGDTKQETVWATIDQISEVFGRDKSVISRHIKNIYKEGELSEKATVAKNATVQTEGSRQIKRELEYYNLPKEIVFDFVNMYINSYKNNINYFKEI